MQEIIKCPNCGNMCMLNEYVKHCSKCGRVFIEYVDIPKDKGIGNRRSLENVDQD